MLIANCLFRPDYEQRATQERIDAITGTTVPYISRSKKAPWIVVSISVTVLLLVAAAASLAGLIAARVAMYAGFRHLKGSFKKYNVEVSRWLAHVFIFVMVTVFEKFYHLIAEKLTVAECPKTDSQFYTSLLWKIFVFAELVDFVPIAYAAFIKGRSVRTPKDLTSLTETCEPGGTLIFRRGLFMKGLF